MKVKIVNTSRHSLPGYATPLSAGGPAGPSEVWPGTWQTSLPRKGLPDKLAGYLANFPVPAGGATRSEKMTYTTIEE